MRILVAHIDSAPPTGFPVQQQDFNLEFTGSEKELREKIYLYEYDCILLCNEDNRLLKLLQEAENRNMNSGLILLSRNLSLDQKVEALNEGADDFLSIPFHFEELKARILAVIRRKRFNTRKNIHFANLIIDLPQRTVLVWDKPVLLTKKEYEILLYLIMNRHKNVSTVSLCEYLWNEENDDREYYNLLLAHMKNLRKKLRQAKAEAEIKNSYGIGYQIIEL